MQKNRCNTCAHCAHNPKLAAQYADSTIHAGAQYVCVINKLAINDITTAQRCGGDDFAPIDGYPGIDCLTFGKWKVSGYIVKKGEHSQIDGLAWVPVSKKTGEGEADSFLMPKAYNLFHRSQVMPLGENAH